ncbi:MAG: nitroreductase family deazaflavin-dependent oxidoreductase [Ktedonobacteraceae bacterium]
MLKVENGVNVLPEPRAKASRTVLKYMNKYYMVPLSKLGLLPWMQNPLTGYIMVLQTIGRKSGRPRLTPLNYALADGYIYCIAGFGSGTHWLANLKANPVVEVRIAGTALRGSAEIVTESEETHRSFIQIIHNCGLASLLVGLNPFTLTDEKILQKCGPEVVVRIRPEEMIGGPFDPGGKGWILATLVQIAFILYLSRLLFRRKRCLIAQVNNENQR